MYTQDSWCIVASTLPLFFIKNQTKELSIRRIYVVSENLYKSYNYLKTFHPSIEIVLLPERNLSSTFFLLRILLTAKMQGTRIIFFHECCMPIFDILIIFFKPNAEYYPQVSMNGSQSVEFDLLPNKIIRNLIKFLGLKKRFQVYYSSPVGENKGEYNLSLIKYPYSVKEYPVAYSRDLIRKLNKRNIQNNSKVLFIIGKSRVDNLTQIKVLNDVIEKIVSLGYECYIKNHPNPYFRLDFHYKDSIELDPLIASELLTNSYSWVIGTSSTSLLNFSKNVVSIIDMLPRLSDENRILIKSHFNSVDPDNKIFYPKNLHELMHYMQIV